MEVRRDSKKWNPIKTCDFHSNLSVRSKSLNLKEFSYRTCDNTFEQISETRFRLRVHSNFQNNSQKKLEIAEPIFQTDSSVIDYQEKQQFSNFSQNLDKSVEILTSEQISTKTQKQEESLRKEVNNFFEHSCLSTFYFLKFLLKAIEKIFNKIIPIELSFEKKTPKFIRTFFKNIAIFLLVFYFIFCAVFWSRVFPVKELKKKRGLKTKNEIENKREKSLSMVKSASERSDVIVTPLFEMGRNHKNCSRIFKTTTYSTRRMNNCMKVVFPGQENQIVKSRSSFRINKELHCQNRKFEFDERFDIF